MFPTSSLTRGLLGLRIGVWLFSYTLFLSMMAAGGAVKDSTPYYLIFLMSVGILLSGVSQAAVFRTRSLSMTLRLCVVALIVLVVTALNAAIDVVTLGRTLVPPDAQTMRYLLLGGLQSFTFLVWIHAFCAACVWLACAFLELLDKERGLAEARTEAQRATLQALRSQVNPHFLFNALNAAAALIATERNRQAEELVIRLSEFFRSSLGTERQAMISLREEFDTLDAYLQIELVRFPGRLELRMDCPEELAQVQVPSFLLLPLVENAIKHAVAHTTSLVVLSISASSTAGRITLVVENEMDEEVGIATSVGEGVGLRNVSQRLQVIYSSAASLEAAPTARGFKAVITMPMYELALP